MLLDADIFVCPLLLLALGLDLQDLDSNAHLALDGGLEYGQLVIDVDIAEESIQHLVAQVQRFVLAGGKE